MLPEQITQNDLKAVKDDRSRERSLRPDGYTSRITVHMGTCGLASGAKPVYEALNELLQEAKREDVDISTSGCIGLCSREPLVTVQTLDMEPVLYGGVDTEGMKAIFASHILEKRLHRDFVLARGLAVNEEPPPDDSPWHQIPHISQFPFFAKQRSWVLRNRGIIDPINIRDYIWRDGYQAAAKAILEMEPLDIIEEVKGSGLRGRGGGGFPTGLKWHIAASVAGHEKVVLCNADEGDPGAFMDRSVMEGDPHSVLEGMIIAARAIGASKGYIYCRAEYPLAVQCLSEAIHRCRELGLLGGNIMNSGFAFDIDIYQGAGAFVCGEETALIASIEGRRGMPKPRPPFPAQSGVWGNPTLLNNVETYGAVPQIILHGAKRFYSLGTQTSRGTKVFALTGNVRNIGLVEVPMGTTLRQIIYEIGGGISGNKSFKAAQLGGPSGGCIPEAHLDISTDYEEISKVGAIMGSGGLIVMDEGTCMVDMARFFMEFCQDESCGKCSPCRVGTKRMLEILERLCRGEGRNGDIELLEDMAVRIKDSALCGLGQTAPNPVLSTIRYFRREYEEHIAGYCSSNVCKAISPAPCQKSCPVGMDVPSYNALIACGRMEEAVEVMHKDNPFPSVCGRLCPRPCETTCVRLEMDKPVSIRGLKRFASDLILEHFPFSASKPPAAYDEKIAVIGAGPCGLTAAAELAGKGYCVTVFDAREKPGGMLRHAVPDFRLPSEIVDREIERLLPLFSIRTGKTLGTDISFLSLLQSGYSSILLALGAPKTLMPNSLPAEKTKNVIDGVKFLQEVKKGKDKKLKGSVAVIGSGHLAWDCTRAALRLGASSAVVLYSRGAENLPISKDELQDLEVEGGRVEYHCVPVDIIKKNKAVAGIRCRRTFAATVDKTGRSRIEEVAGSEYTIPCTAVIAASGHKPDAGFLKSEPLLRFGLLDTIVVDPMTLETGIRGVFAAGDMVTAGATVIEAIASGQKAAESIHRRLRNLPYAPHKLSKPRLRVEAFANSTEQPEFRRPGDPRIAAELRNRTFTEVVGTYSLKEAQLEARRCLRCDLD